MFLKKTGIILTAAFAFSLLNTAKVGAMTALSVSPADFSLKGNAKETVEEKISIGNTSQDIVSYKIYTTPYYVPDGEDKTPNFTSRVGHNSDAIDWISFDKEAGTLPAGESNEISFAIKIPECSASSHQWFAIFAEEVSGENTPVVEAEQVQGEENKEEVKTETHSDSRIAAIVNLEISDNHPENCGGTADDPNPPYVKSNTDEENKNSSKLPLLIGIIAGSIAVVGVISFLVLKKFGKKKPASTPKDPQPTPQA